jgi:hypothetical protein
MPRTTYRSCLGRITYWWIKQLIKGDTIMENIFAVIMWIYGIISQIMSLVFFIDFCRTDSFLQILFIDTWLSELKGILWIFFIW